MKKREFPIHEQSEALPVLDAQGNVINMVLVPVGSDWTPHKGQLGPKGGKFGMRFVNGVYEDLPPRGGPPIDIPGST